MGVADEVVERMRALDVCTLADALDASGIDGAVPGLRPMWEGAVVVGRAVTTRLAVGPPPPAAPPVHLGSRAIEAARPGDVIVVDNSGRTDMGSWGGLLCAAALAVGVGGVVTDGACRDVDEAREAGFPVFARAAAVRTARGRVHEVACGEPVDLAGVLVRPGDIVAADGSGVVVIPAEMAMTVADVGESIAGRERVMLADLRSGVPVTVVLGASYEGMLQEPNGTESG